MSIPKYTLYTKQPSTIPLQPQFRSQHFKPLLTSGLGRSVICCLRYPLLLSKRLKETSKKAILNSHGHWSCSVTFPKDWAPNGVQQVNSQIRTNFCLFMCQQLLQERFLLRLWIYTPLPQFSVPSHVIIFTIIFKLQFIWLLFIRSLTIILVH